MKKFAVFDIDGTLIRWQLYHAVVDRLAKHDLLEPGTHEAVRAARMVWKRREHPEAFRAYETKVITAYEAALPNLTVEQFTKIVEETASEYKEQVYSYTRDLTKSLGQQNYVLLAISGSHQELVAQVGKQFGFDDCVGTQYLQINGRFTGEKTVGSHDKKAVLEGLIKKHNLTLKGSYGIGDSQSDAVMLAVVKNPIAFNPDRQLFDIARGKGWNIVIERKNVVYELHLQSGKYQLQ